VTERTNDDAQEQDEQGPAWAKQLAADVARDEAQGKGTDKDKEAIELALKIGALCPQCANGSYPDQWLLHGLRRVRCPAADLHSQLRALGKGLEGQGPPTPPGPMAVQQGWR
jgi:hypothetical protein